MKRRCGQLRQTPAPGRARRTPRRAGTEAGHCADEPSLLVQGCWPCSRITAWLWGIAQDAALQRVAFPLATRNSLQCTAARGRGAPAARVEKCDGVIDLHGKGHYVDSLRSPGALRGAGGARRSLLYDRPRRVPSRRTAGGGGGRGGSGCHRQTPSSAQQGARDRPRKELPRGPGSLGPAHHHRTPPPAPGHCRPIPRAAPRL
eukprot:scaffold518_cov388-Prasinococcus_capsulatus_cf.AAC.77